MPHAALLHAANPPWVQILAALGAPIAAIIAVFVAFWQGCLQRQQLRHNLFPKQFDVYLSLRRFLNRLPDLGKTLDAAQLLQDTNQAEFLFKRGFLFRKPDIAEFLQEVSKKARHYQSHKEQEERVLRQGMVPPLLPDNLESEDSWLFSEAPTIARQKFAPYFKHLR